MQRIGRHITFILLAGFGIWMNGMAQPDWPVSTDTYYQQTIRIESETLTSDTLVLLEDGDVLGAFFSDEERNSICSGKMTWNVSNAVNQMTVYNNSLVDNKASEDFYFRIWKKSQNCILDSVRGFFIASEDTMAAITEADTLYVSILSGKPFHAGFDKAQYCDNEGLVLPNKAPADYNLTYASDQYAIDAANGVIDLNGEFSGTMNVRFTSDYCLSAPSQSLTILPAPEISFPDVMNICEGEKMDSMMNQYIAENSTDTDLLWISGISEGIEISPETYRYSVILNNGECTTNKSIGIRQLPKPLIRWEMEDRCDSVRVILLNEGGSASWSTGSEQKEVFLSSSSSITVEYTDINGCRNSASRDIQVKQMRFEEFNAEEINADCYTPGRISLHNDRVVNYEGTYDLWVRNLITGEEFLMNSESLSLKEGRYRVTALDDRNCKAEWQKELIIMKDCLNDNPVFSPNSDGMDDDFYISYEGMVYIYNKNGRLIHQFQGPAYWNGTDERGLKLPLGIYLLVTGSEAKTITIIR